MKSHLLIYDTLKRSNMQIDKDAVILRYFKKTNIIETLYLNRMLV